MTNEEIIEKIRTTLAEEFEVDIDVIQPDAPLMETLELDSLDLVDMVVLVEKNFGLFETFEKWGVKGVKIDFMDRSDQWMVNYYERELPKKLPNIICSSISTDHLNRQVWNINTPMSFLMKG